MSTEKTQSPATQSNSRIESEGGSGMSLAAPAFSLSAGAADQPSIQRKSSAQPLQLVGELTPEQATAAIAFNNGLGIEANNIRQIQFALGVAVTGVFDQATVVGINTFSDGSLGQLNAAAFAALFTRLTTQNQFERLIPLALDYLNLAQTDFISVTHSPQATYSYRVNVPFSTLQVDSASSSQVLNNAPNRLKNVTLGPAAFTSPATFSTAITAVNAVQYQTTPQTGAQETATTTTATPTPQLTATQATAAQSHNNFILSDALPRRIIQAAIGVAQSGTFDAASVQAIADYQRANAIARQDGRIDRATLDHIVRYMVTQGQREAVLRVAADFYNLGELPVQIIMRHNPAVTGDPTSNKEVAGVESFAFGNAAFANGLQGLETALDQAVGEGTSMNGQAMDVLLADTNTARRNAMWSNPDAANEGGLVPWIRDNFPTQEDLAAFLARTDLTEVQKTASFGLFSVELGRLEFLMGVIFHGGNDQTWENLVETNTNRGTFVNHYKDAVGNSPNTQPWCTMFSGYLKTLLGFEDSLSDSGPLIFNSGKRLDYWGTAGTNYLTGQDDFSDPSDFANYSGASIDTAAWVTLRNSVSGTGLTQDQKQTAVDTFFSTRTTPQPGDILIINTGVTNNTYSGTSSHTTTIESYSGYTISTIEGNRDQKVTGVELDMRNPADVGQLLCLVRTGTEFFTENQAAPAPQNGQPAAPAPSQEDILRPLRQMVRNLQLIADHKSYIDSNVAGATVADMAGGTASGGTQ